MHSKKGQQAAELLLVFSTAFAIFIVFYSIFAQQYAASMRGHAQSDAMSVADGIAGEIDLAARSGDGYQRKIVYPTTIPGIAFYSIKINNISGSVDINASLGTVTQQYNYSSPTLTRSIVGEPRYAVSDGFMIETDRGYAYIENQNGTIFVTQMRVG